MYRYIQWSIFYPVIIIILCLFPTPRRLYMSGIDLAPLRLHGDAVQYPVTPGTPMIAPLLTWDHSTSWAVPTYDQFTAGEYNDVIRM